MTAPEPAGPPLVASTPLESPTADMTPPSPSTSPPPVTPPASEPERVDIPATAASTSGSEAEPRVASNPTAVDVPLPHPPEPVPLTHQEAANDGNAAAEAATGTQSVTCATVEKMQVLTAQNVFFDRRRAEKRKQAKPTAPPDPTEPLPSLAASPGEFRFADVERCWEDLDACRVLLLASFDGRTALSAAYTVVRGEQFRVCEHRTLLLNKPGNRQRTDMRIDLFAEPEYPPRTREIVIVEIDRPGDFLDSILTATLTQAGRLKDVLRARESYVICALTEHLLAPRTGEPAGNETPFRLHRLPYLRTVLQQHFAAARAAELVAALERLRNRRLWPTQADLYQQVSAWLRQGPEVLEAEVRHRDALPPDLSPTELRSRLEPVRPAELLAGDDGVRGAVLYAVTYFPHATPHEFDHVVRLVLGARTVKLEEVSESIDEHGAVRSLHTKVERALTDLWNDAPDTHLSACHLEAVVQPDGRRGLDFTVPYLRREVRQHLETKAPLFVTAAFAALETSGLLFNASMSDAFVDDFVRLCTQSISADPTRYGQRWLLERVEALRPQLHLALGHSRSSPPIVAVLAQVPTAQRQHICLRLVRLIRFMVEHESLQAVVDCFLQSLVDGGADEETVGLLMELTRRLRAVPQFNALHWIRRLLDQAADAAPRIYEQVLDLAYESGPRVHSILAGIACWLPARGKTEDLTPAEHAAVVFLPDYAYQAAQWLDSRSWGRWPSPYGLFADFPQEHARALEAWQPLADWLTHPALTQLATLACKDPDQTHVWLADLLELWLLILEGLNPTATSPAARTVADALISTIAPSTTPRQRHALARRWQVRQSECLTEAARLAPSERHRRGELLARRTKLLELRTRFTAAASHSPEPTTR